MLVVYGFVGSDWWLVNDGMVVNGGSDMVGEQWYIWWLSALRTSFFFFFFFKFMRLAVVGGVCRRWDQQWLAKFPIFFLVWYGWHGLIIFGFATVVMVVIFLIVAAEIGGGLFLLWVFLFEVILYYFNRLYSKNKNWETETLSVL